MSEKVVPYKDSDKGKKEQVAEMFNSISRRYDLLNTVLSAGINKFWKKQLIKATKPVNGKIVLDVATGTADVAIALAAYHPASITGVDISEKMMEIGRSKIEEKGLQNLIELKTAGAEELPFDNNKFDIVTVSYGVRNFELLEKGLLEIYRVMKPGARLVILEFSKPKGFPIQQLFSLYFRLILPLIGRWIAKDAHAYTYLPKSVQEFPEGDAFLRILQSQGFAQTQCKPLTFGITSLYTALKPS
jgi:demethylmenaquinone methyltransferase/2-methoxy-6-polyprenyl-1,4-benzoquinol methylase